MDCVNLYGRAAKDFVKLKALGGKYSFLDEAKILRRLAYARAKMSARFAPATVEYYTMNISIAACRAE